MKHIALFVMILLLLTACTPLSSSPQDGPPPPPVLQSAKPAGSEEPDALQTGEGARIVTWMLPWRRTYHPFKMTTHGMDVTDAGYTVGSINAALAEQGMGRMKLKLEVSKDYHQYYIYDLQLALVSDEPRDLIYIPAELPQIKTWMDMGLFKEINLANYPVLDELYGEERRRPLSRDGHMFGLTTGTGPLEQNGASYLLMRQDVLPPLYNEIETVEDIVNAVRYAYDNSLPYKVGLDYWSAPLHAFHRAYPEYPFKVSEDSLFVYDKDGNVKPYAGSEVLTHDFDLMYRLKQISLDTITAAAKGDFFEIVTTPLSRYFNTPAISPIFADWNMLFALGSTSAASSYEYMNANPDSLAAILLAPEKPQISRNASPLGSGINIVPSAAPDDYAGLALLDWIYSSQDNYNLIALGVEGRNYYVDEYGNYNSIFASGHNYFEFINQKLVYQPEYHGVNANMPDAMKCIYAQREYELMPFDGFVFDPTPVAEEYEAVLQENMDMVQLKNGVTTYHTLEDLPKMIDDLENAGFKSVLAECRRQYAEFMKEKGWKR